MRKIIIAGVGIIILILVALLVFKYYTSPYSSVFGKNCGSYATAFSMFQSDKTSNDPSKTDTNDCFLDAFNTCTPAYVSVTGHGWEGGNDWTTMYSVVQKDGVCGIKVDHNESMSIGGEVRDLQFCRTISTDDSQNLAVSSCSRVQLDCPEVVCPISD